MYYIDMDILKKLQKNPKNPRTISKGDFQSLKKKISEFPEMLEKRPIVYDESYIVLGGNQRFSALQELAQEGFKIKDEYFKQALNWTEEQKRKFVILDNISDGLWDWDIIANEWTDLPLADWGLDPVAWEGEKDKANTERLDEKKEIKCPNCGHEFTN